MFKKQNKTTTADLGHRVWFDYSGSQFFVEGALPGIMVGHLKEMILPKLGKDVASAAVTLLAPKDSFMLLGAAAASASASPFIGVTDSDGNAVLLATAELDPQFFHVFTTARASERSSLPSPPPPA